MLLGKAVIMSDTKLRSVRVLWRTYPEFTTQHKTGLNKISSVTIYPTNVPQWTKLVVALCPVFHPLP